MSIKVGELYATLGLDDKPFEKGLGDVDRKMGGLGGSAKKLGGAIGGALAVGGLVNIGTQLFDIGVKMESAQKKATTVFGDWVIDVEQWSDANAAALGLTSKELLGLAGNFGDLLKPMGFNNSETMELTTKTLDLAGALSSWSGGTKSAAEVADTLASAMLGETDGLKALGIAISASDVETKALAMTSKKSAKDLTEMDNALAVQALVFEKSGDAQAAWAAGGNKAMIAANKLKSQINTLKEEVAAKLMPAMVAAMTYLGDHAPAVLARLTEWFNKLRPRVQELAATIIEKLMAAWDFIMPTLLSIVEVIKDITKFVNENREILVALAIAIGLVLVPAFVAWALTAGAAAVATILAIAPILAMVAGIALLVLGVMKLVEHWDEFSAMADTVWEMWKSIPGKIASVASGMWDSISQAFKDMINYIIRLWNQLEFQLPSFAGLKVKGITVIPGWEGPTLGVPKIREMAEGGIARARIGGVMARVAERGEDEVVAPLSKLKGMLGIGNGVGGGFTVIIRGDVLDGTDFQRKINQAQVEYDRRNRGQ